MVLSVIPVLPSPNQTFDCTVPVNGDNRKFKFFFEWNPVGNYWQFDLHEVSTGAQLLNKVPVFCESYPYNNIIKRYSYKKIGSLYVVNLSGTTQDRPQYDNLGSSYILVWGDNE